LSAAIGATLPALAKRLAHGYHRAPMGLFSFFNRRRQRESAIPEQSTESLTRQLKGDGKPVGQPISQAFPQQPSDNLTGATDLGSIMAMMQQAFQAGNVQISQGENQVIDMRGSGELRDQILDAMRQHGIDPENATAEGQINAADYQGLQQQIMDALQSHGVDVGAAGFSASDMPQGGFDISAGDGGGSSDSGADSGGSSDSGGGDSGGGSGGGGE
jgi:uncharacterized membrane protein YgcG